MIIDQVHSAQIPHLSPMMKTGTVAMPNASAMSATSPSTDRARGWRKRRKCFKGAGGDIENLERWRALLLLLLCNWVLFLLLLLLFVVATLQQGHFWHCFCFYLDLRWIFTLSLTFCEALLRMCSFTRTIILAVSRCYAFLSFIVIRCITMLSTIVVRTSLAFLKKQQKQIQGKLGLRHKISKAH